MKRKLVTLAMLVGLAAAVGCGSDGPDVGTIPPADIKDLMVSALTESTIALTWTAPPDLPEQSVAFSYDFRYAQADLSQDWEAGTKVTSLGKPQEPGTEEMITVEGLVRSERYSFGLRTTDKLGNESGTSNVVWAEPMDVTAPGQITDLSAEVLTSTQVGLSWTATGDDGGTGRATRYEARYFTEELTEANWDKAVSFKVVDPPALAGNPDQYTVEELEALTTYWFGVRAVDDGMNLGPLSNVVSVTMLRSPITWTVKEDGSGDAPTVQAGIDLAIDGDEVLVGPGRYVENIDFKGKSLFLRSEQGRDVTILDGSGSPGGDSVITLSAEESVTIEGFTITGGKGKEFLPGIHRGGAIYSPTGSMELLLSRVERNKALGLSERSPGAGGGLFVGNSENPSASLRVYETVFHLNITDGNGGAVELLRVARCVIEKSVFSKNSCEFDGGAIHHLGATTPEIQVLGNRFFANAAGDHGGGIHLGGTSNTLGTPVLIARNVFEENVGRGTPTSAENGSGGGLYLIGVTGLIERNTFVKNEGYGERKCPGGGVFLNHRTTQAHLSPVIRNNIFAENSGCGISCSFPASTRFQDNLLWRNEDGDLGAGERRCPEAWSATSVLEDPLFCNPQAGDYSVSDSSPALKGKEAIGAFGEPGCN